MSGEAGVERSNIPSWFGDLDKVLQSSEVGLAGAHVPTGVFMKKDSLETRVKGGIAV